MADQQPRVELWRIQFRLAKCLGQRAARLRDGHARREQFLRSRASIAFGRQQLGLMLGDQRVDDLAQRFAFHHLGQIVERQIDAVIGDAALREIVGADALGAVARADLILALGGAGVIELLVFSAS